MLSRRSLTAAALFLVAVATLCLSPRVAPVGDGLPDRLNDATFWQLVEELSEDGGYFRSDNLISNEETYQHVIPTLRDRVTPGGAYLGVGPDQNFTYIVAVQPKLAFIVDIRRQNMLLQLMYKALVELSEDRAELLSRLFSRKRPATLPEPLSVRALFDAFVLEPPDQLLFRRNLRAVIDRLVQVHRFQLSSDDVLSIEYVFRAFFEAGPDLRYSFPRQLGGGRWFPSYAELMTGTDAEGEPHSYLATERNYRMLRGYQMNNLVVPIVGDFGGKSALKAIARYLRAHSAVVTLFYTSNVEQYLFQSSGWRQFFDNVGSLPTDGNSTIVRSFFNTGFGYRPQVRLGPGSRSAMLVDSIPDLLSAVRGGHVQSYYDVIERSR